MSKEELFLKLAAADAATVARIAAALDGNAPAQLPCVKLYTITQAAKEAGFSRATACRMIKAGTLKTVELRPGCKRVPASELVRIAEGRGQGSEVSK